MARHGREGRRKGRQSAQVFRKQSILSKLMYVNSIAILHLLADKYEIYNLISELIKKL